MTGFQGTFVISWAQTEVDGLAIPPRAAIGVGASWRWSGTAVRVDGPQDVLRLDGAEGEAHFRRRAARKVGRLVGLAMAGPGARAPRTEDDTPLFEYGFEVTDGYRSYSLTLIEVGAGHAPLLMALDGVPPSDTDLWVVRTQMEAAEVNRVTERPTGMICFTPGTRIRTDVGDIAIEDIREGDRVQTRDDGMQEVLWIGRKRLTGARLYAMPELRPIRLRQGALGVDRPDEDLLVSPNHRMLVTGARAQALFNTDEVFVRARDLVDDVRVVRDHSLREVTYVHLLLERHQVVIANGLATESFHPAGSALDTVDPEERARLMSMIPDLGSDPARYGAYARRALSRAEAAILSSHAA